MTEQDGRARGGNGRPSALEAAFGRPPGVDSSFAPGAPPVPPPAPPPPPPAPGLRRTVRPARPVWRSPSTRRPARSGTPPRRPSRPGGSRTPRSTPGGTRSRRPGSAARRTSATAAPRRSRRPRGSPPAAAAAAGACATSPSPPRSCCCVAGLLSGIAGGVVGYLAADRITPALLDPHATLSSVSPPVTRPPGSIADIAKRVLPVVVSVEVSSSAGSGTGSGVVIDGAGYILTNNHVVSEIADQRRPATLRVRFNDQSAVRRPDRRPRPEDRPGRAQGRRSPG